MIPSVSLHLHQKFFPCRSSLLAPPLVDAECVIAAMRDDTNSILMAAQTYQVGKNWAKEVTHHVKSLKSRGEDKTKALTYIKEVAEAFGDECDVSWPSNRDMSSLQAKLVEIDGFLKQLSASAKKRLHTDPDLDAPQFEAMKRVQELIVNGLMEIANPVFTGAVAVSSLLDEAAQKHLETIKLFLRTLQDNAQSMDMFIFYVFSILHRLDSAF